MAAKVVPCFLEPVRACVLASGVDVNLQERRALRDGSREKKWWSIFIFIFILFRETDRYQASRPVVR